LTGRKAKEIIVSPAVSESSLDDFLSKLIHIKILNIDPRLAPKGKFKTLFESKDADMVICKTVSEIRNAKSADKIVGYSKKVLSNVDLDEVVSASILGAEFVIVEADDWKIIPLENIISRLHKSGTKIYTTAKSAAEVRTMFNILEMGVDGVILSTRIPRKLKYHGSIWKIEHLSSSQQKSWLSGMWEPGKECVSILHRY